jgi:hypothetical protein
MKVPQIIKSYFNECLVTNQSIVIGNHIIQTKLPDYGVTVCGKLHSSDTYSRAWRSIREPIGIEQFDIVRPPKYWEGFKITEEPGVDSREKYFRIERIKT